VTIVEAVVLKAMEKLNAAGKPGTVPATERVRTFAIPTEALPSSIIYPIRIPVLNPTTPRRGAVQLGIAFAVEVRVKGDGVSSPDALFLPIFDWVIKALCNTFEPGLWTDVEFVDCPIEYGQADFAFSRASIELRALSQMKTNDASAAA